MKSKTFIILLVTCAALTLFTYVTVNHDDAGKKQEKMGGKLFSDLPLKAVALVTVKGADESVTLKKGEDVWLLENKFNYPASFSLLTEIVSNLKDAAVGRSFKADDETLSRLSLQSPDNKDKAAEERGVEVILQDKDSKVLADVIVGKARPEGGHYLMLAKDSTVYLVDKTFRNLDKKLADWLDKELTEEINSADIEKVVCRDGEKILYTFKRPEKGKDAEFEGSIPEGKKLKRAKVNDVFGAMSYFRIDDIADPAKKAEETGLDKALCFEFYLFDGTVYKAYPGSELTEDKEKSYFKAEVAYLAPEKKAEEKTDEADKAEADKDKKQEQPEKAEEKPKSDADISADAKKLNEKISPWVYVISKWKHEKFIANADDFFEEVKAEPKPESKEAVMMPPGPVHGAEIQPPKPEAEVQPPAPGAEAEEVKPEETQETESAESQEAEPAEEVAEPEPEGEDSEAETVEPEPPAEVQPPETEAGVEPPKPEAEVQPPAPDTEAEVKPEAQETDSQSENPKP